MFAVKTFLLLVLLCIFPNSSLAKWSFVTTNAIGDRYYVDYSRVKKEGDGVYFWILSKYAIPVFRSFSATSYIFGDCVNLRYQNLEQVFHMGTHGQGKSREVSSEILQKWGWRYLEQSGSDYQLLKSVCAAERPSVD